MNRAEVIQAIDAEIDRLSKARALLTDHTAPLKRGRPAGSGGRKGKVSAETRALMAAAQKTRWAKTKG